MFSVNRTTYMPFWTVGTDRRMLSYWPRYCSSSGWAWSRRTDGRLRMIFFPGFVIHLGR